MANSEREPLLGSSSDHTTDKTLSKESHTRSDRDAGDIRRSLTTKKSTEERSTSSSSYSLRFFKTHSSPLPTVSKSFPVDSNSTVPDENEIKEHSGREVRTEITQLQFCMHLVRASIGTGMLSSPSAVANAGLPIAMTGILITSFIILHGMNLLVECSNFLKNRYGLHDVYLDYGTTVKYAFVYGTQSARKYRWSSKLLNFALGAVQFGVTTVYMLFVAESIRFMIDHYQPHFSQPLVIHVLIASIALLPVSFVKNLKFLSILSTMGNILLVISMAFLIVYCFQDLPPIENYPLITSIERIPLFFGVVVFSFESINVILPLEIALKDKRNLLGPFGLLNSTFYMIILIDLAVAFYGYVKFGESVGGSLTYSLPFTPWYAMLPKPLYAILIAFSFGLQFYILIEISWRAITSITPAQFHKDWINNLLRFVVYLAVFGVAVGVPYIEHVISLTGAVAGSSVCFIFPAIIHSILFWEHRNRFYSFKLTVTKNLLIVIFGAFGAGIGSYTSILAIYNEIQMDYEK